MHSLACCLAAVYLLQIIAVGLGIDAAPAADAGADIRPLDRKIVSVYFCRDVRDLGVWLGLEDSLQIGRLRILVDRGNGPELGLVGALIANGACSFLQDRARGRANVGECCDEHLVRISMYAVARY